jgi:periplasmic protein TonB
MTRLQKKCLIAAAGTHLLVVVAVLCSGFVVSKPKVDETQLLDVIPATAIEAALNSGVKNYTPPAPQPVVQPQPQPQVQPQPQPQPEPPKPVVQPPPKPVDPVPVPEKPDPDFTPVKIPDKPVKRHEIKPDFTPVKRTDTDDAAARQQALREAQRQRDRQAQAFREAMRSIQKNASSATSVEMPGHSSVSYANYASIVKSIYEREWTAPDSSASDDANVKVKVVISRDGSVISAHIIGPSGDGSVDSSVQRTLDRVSFIAPFPEGATENEKTFVINFNLKAKRMFG